MAPRAWWTKEFLIVSGEFLWPFSQPQVRASLNTNPTSRVSRDFAICCFFILFLLGLRELLSDCWMEGSAQTHPRLWKNLMGNFPVMALYQLPVGPGESDLTGRESWEEEGQGCGFDTEIK